MPIKSIFGSALIKVRDIKGSVTLKEWRCLMLVQTSKRIWTRNTAVNSGDAEPQSHGEAAHRACAELIKDYGGHNGGQWESLMVNRPGYSLSNRGLRARLALVAALRGYAR